jgi:hypothetical protein
MYKQNSLNWVPPLMCKTNKQHITSHASEDKGKFHHPRRTKKYKKVWTNPE